MVELSICFVKFGRNTVGGIEFKNGGDEEQNNPSAMRGGHKIDVETAMTGEQTAHNVVAFLEREKGGDYEKNIGYQHYPAQTAHRNVTAFIALCHLHRREGNRTDKEQHRHNVLTK